MFTVQEIVWHCYLFGHRKKDCLCLMGRRGAGVTRQVGLVFDGQGMLGLWFMNIGQVGLVFDGEGRLSLLFMDIRAG